MAPVAHAPWQRHLRFDPEDPIWPGRDRLGPEGAMVGMHTFGSSAPLKDVMSEFGFTPDKVAEPAAARSSAPPATKLRTERRERGSHP